MNFDACRIGENAEDESRSKYIYPDFFRVLNSPIEIGDNVFVPMITKDDEVAFWESGGRKENANVSTGTIIAGDNDRILSGTLFGRRKNKTNGRHALIAMRPGNSIYIGKLNIRRNILAPTIRVLHLFFEELDTETYPEYNGIGPVGRFSVKGIFTKYGDLEGILPAERLITKIYTCNVVRPYYANGWNTVNKPLNQSNYDALVQNVRRLIASDKVITEMDPNRFLDKLEDEITANKGPRLSSILQHINFETGDMRMIPLTGLDLREIKGTIGATEACKTFAIDIHKMQKCYNPNILFGSTDINMLEVALCHDTNFAIQVGVREFVFLRSWRG